MPLLQIYTTIARSKIPTNFASKTAVLLTQLLNKPMKAIVVNVNSDQNIFSGTDPEGKEEKAFVTLRNVGKLNISQNESTTAQLYQHINKELGITETELKIFFTDLDAYSVGIGSKLRANIPN